VDYIIWITLYGSSSTLRVITLYRITNYCTLTSMLRMARSTAIRCQCLYGWDNPTSIPTLKLHRINTSMTSSGIFEVQESKATISRVNAIDFAFASTYKPLSASLRCGRLHYWALTAQSLGLNSSPSRNFNNLSTSLAVIELSVQCWWLS
jgi:hypothetical protein